MRILTGLAAVLLAGPGFAACNTDLQVPDGVRLTGAEQVAKGDESPREHCRITGVMNEREGVDGMAYALRFELRLPDEWNGRFVHQFNGGNDGEVKPAFGPLLSGLKDDTALARGYAVVSSDAGHDGAAFGEAGLAGGARFGFDPQARAAYGYTAVRDLHPVATGLTETFYGQQILYTYGIGGSNGGRHAMVAAARMPDAFDGLLIGYPGFNLPRAALQHALDVQAFHGVSGDLKTAFTRDDLNLVADRIRQTCDGLDGLEDGLVYDVNGCLASFDPSMVQCAEQSSGCLTEAQVNALYTIFTGPLDEDGEPLYADWAWDPGIASGNWRFWKLESPIPPWGNKPIIAVMGAASLAQIFTTPPTEVAGSPEALEQFLLDFDIQAEASQIFATDDTFVESAMEVMTPPGVDEPELAEFRDTGGKMLILHGNADPVFSVLDTTSWYERLDLNNDDEAERFALFYRIPGMPHGAGGPSTDGFDMLTPLVNWVENGEAPGAIEAHVTDGNAEGQDALGDISRPLCPYPTIARYQGGDAAQASSFACE